MSDEFTSKIRACFAQYDSTLSFVDELIQSRRHPQEILILICSRLDALANSAGSEDETQKRKFIRFVTNYGTRARFFNRVSLGDLYYEIGYHRWILPGLISKPGRLHSFSDVNHEIIILLDESGVELTQEGADRLLSKMQRCIATHYRVRARQSHTKPPAASANEIIDTLARSVRGVSSDVLKNIPKAIKPLLSSKTTGAILYERFRSEVIHGGKVRVDEQRFFRERQPYWKPLFSEYYGSFLFLEFPASFLRQLLLDCLHTFESHIVAKRKAPPNIHFEMFPDDVFAHLDWLDEDLMPEVRDVRLSIPRG